MTKRKFSENICNFIAVAVFATCVLFLFSYFLSVNVKADTETNSVFCLSALTDHCKHPYSGENNKSENVDTPCCPELCSSSSCCIVMLLSRIPVSSNSNALTNAILSFHQQFNTEDILCSIFKPPKF